VRVVFDTNVIVSAFMFPGRQAEKALERVTYGRDHLLISHAIIDEALTVMARKFKQNAKQLADDAILLAQVGEILPPSCDSSYSKTIPIIASSNARLPAMRT
jgi:uncharacterized protein